jgi:heavy metal sensor kinase
VIRWPRTIHARLTMGYAIAFFVGLIVFAAIAFTSLDDALKAVVDARLHNAETLLAQVLSRDPKVSHVTRERLELVTGSNMSSAVLSDDGRAVYSSTVTILPAVRSAILGARSDPAITTVRAGDFAARIATQHVRTPDGSAFSVGIWRPLDLVGALERIRLVVLVTDVIVIGAVAVLVGSLIARQGLEPLRAVAALASEIEAHDLSRRLHVESDPSELGQLASTFDKMLARLEHAFERQRRFTADASHELRAPLAVMHVAAEVALRHDREPAAYRRVIASMLVAAEQLEELTECLLAAARSDAGHVCIERVDLSEVLTETVARLQPLAESKQVTIVGSGETRAVVNVDRPGIARAIIALIDNAIKFSPRGGAVTATVSAQPASIRLTVIDDGPGFTEEGLRLATGRFWRSDAVRAPGSGSGLGLAICESIVRASGGTLVPQNADGRGALVAIEFPRVRG